VKTLAVSRSIYKRLLPIQ